MLLTQPYGCPHIYRDAILLRRGKQHINVCFRLSQMAIYTGILHAIRLRVIE